MHSPKHSPSNTESSGTPKSDAQEADPVVSTPVSDHGDAANAEKASSLVAAIDMEDKGVDVVTNKTQDSPKESHILAPDDHVFVKPALPDRLQARKEAQPSSDLFNFDFGLIHSTLPSKFWHIKGFQVQLLTQNRPI